MRLFQYILPGIACAVLTGCFKAEPANSECDITAAWVHLDNPSEAFFSLTDTLVGVQSDKSAIEFNVRSGLGLAAMSPMFTITDGARIEPASGSTHDFSNGRQVSYRVTSEDGAWHRDYTVAFRPENRVVGDTLCFDFEQYSLKESSVKGSYCYVWEDPNPNCTWATGNAGFAMARSSAKPDEYPSVPMAEGYDGAAVALETRDTGMFGVMGGMRLAAGNLFLGVFDATNALGGNALVSTKFGVRFDRKPIKLTGYYRYRPGAKYQDKNGNEVAGRTDSADIYAVIYQNHDSIAADHTAAGNAVVLDGSNVLSSKYIVGVARMGTIASVDEWTPFEIAFDYTSELDFQLLNNYGYNITVVFSSSKDGGLFQGAVGSRLCIDKVRLISEKPE